MNVFQKDKGWIDRTGPYFWGLAVAWTLVVVASLIWNIHQERQNILEEARIYAEVAYNKDVIYRRWNTEHGGVYVPVTEKTLPNPYLDLPERDIITPSGRQLTLINPAYMTRQVHELGAETYGVRGHITSLIPVRPENAPDPWETQALEAIQQGEKEISSVEAIKGKDYMRLMRPLLVEEGCMKCHAAQGYKVGDIRGGISVSVPMAPLSAIKRSHMMTLSIAHGLLWLFGIGGINFGTRRLKQRIRERKQAEEALQESKERLNTIFDAVQAGIFIIDVETHEIIDANPVAVDMIGVPKEKVLGSVCHQYICPAQKGRCPITDLGQTVDNSERVLLKADGESVPILKTVVEIELNGRKCLLESFIDITERKKMEEKVQKSEERYRKIYELSPEAIVLLDSKGNVLDVNGRLYDWLSYKPEEVIGKHLLELPYLPEESKAEIKEKFSRRMAGEDVPPYELDFIARSGEKRIGWILAAPLIDEEGKIIQDLVVISDITERKRAEEELTQYRDHLEELVKERTHELQKEITERKRAEESIRDHSAFLSVLAELRGVGREESEEVLWENLLAAIVKQYGFLMAWYGDYSDGRVIPKHSAGHVDRYLEGLVLEIREPTSPDAQCAMSRAVLDGEPFGYSDLANDKGFRKWRDYALELGYKSNIALPIEVNGQIEGGIMMYADTVAAFPKERVERLLLLTQEVGDVLNERRHARQAEAALRKSKTMLQSVFDGISDPLIMFDRNLSVKVLNKAAAGYYQVELQKVIGKPCYQGFRGRSTPCEGCDIPSAVLSGKVVAFERQGTMNPDRFEQVVVYPLREEAGAIIRISDITEAKLMQRQMIQSEKMASLGLLVSGIAHEINNPNNFITFNIPILRDYLQGLMPILDDYGKGHRDFELFGMSYPEFREDMFKLLDNVEHGSDRINSIVSDLREFSKRKDKRERVWSNIKQVIERVVAICRGEIKKKVKSFEMEIPEDLPEILTDPHTLEQVLINLLINAVHAADKKDSWIRLSVAPGDTQRDHLIIEVSDNGRGMDEKTREKIFDPFFTTKTHEVGTGLGLYVCHNLVEGLGGRIEVESEQGKGSTFRVILPDEGKRDLKLET